MQHPTFEQLIQYAEKRLDDADRAAIDEHFAIPCERCRAQLASLEAVLRTAEGSPTFAPRPAVLRRAFSVFRKRHGTHGSARPVQRAGLVFDSRLQPTLAGVRGALQNRQMLFRIGEIEIDLQITPERSERRLLGQILGSKDLQGSPSAFVCLSGHDGAIIQGAEADHFGQFAFRRIPSGTYDLVFDIRGQEIAITDLDLGNDR